MVSRAEIKQNIDLTRDNISLTVEELSETVHNRFDIERKIRQNPQKALLIAAGAGFMLASFSSPIGKMVFRFALKTAAGAAGAYLSKQGMSYLKEKVKNR